MSGDERWSWGRGGGVLCGSLVVYFQGWSHFPFIAWPAAICLAPLIHRDIAHYSLFLLASSVVLLFLSVTSVGTGYVPVHRFFLKWVHRESLDWWAIWTIVLTLSTVCATKHRDPPHLSVFSLFFYPSFLFCLSTLGFLAWIQKRHCIWMGPLLCDWF